MNTEIKIIPLQSDDSEFDNFFGLKFGTNLYEVLFQMRAMGWQYEGSMSSYGRKKETVFFNGNHQIGNCIFEKIRLGFVLKRNIRILNSIAAFYKQKDNNSEELKKKIYEIATNNNLVVKHNKYYLHKPTKRILFTTCNKNKGEIECSINIEAKNARVFIDDNLSTTNKWFLFNTKYIAFNQFFSNKDLKDEFYCLLAAFSKAYNYNECHELINFWDDKKKSEVLIELSKKIKKIFDEERQDYEKDTICAELKSCIESAKVVAVQKIKNEKEEKQAKKDAANKEFSDSLDDL